MLELDELAAGESSGWAGELDESLLGEDEWAGESDELAAYESSDEAEPFFKGIKRLSRGIFRNPLFRAVRRIAPRLVATAVGGAFGPAGAMLTNKLSAVAARAFQEQAGPGAFEEEIPEMHEFAGHESADELGFESSDESSAELATEFDRELAAHEAQAEVMAHFAAQAESEPEAQAFIGGAVTMTLSARDRRALRRLVPALLRGATVLSRVLRMRRATRPALALLPTLMRRTVRNLQASARAGRPLTQARAAQAMATQTRRLFANPTRCAAALRRNQQYARPVARSLSRRRGGI